MSEPVAVESNKFLPTEDRIAILKNFEQFCVETAMNHLLDSDLSVFLISDCIISLASLVESIVGRDIYDSFHFQRINRYHHIMRHIMIHNGFWRGDESDRDAYLKAIQEVSFPFEKYFGMPYWERVG